MLLHDFYSAEVYRESLRMMEGNIHLLAAKLRAKLECLNLGKRISCYDAINQQSDILVTSKEASGPSNTPDDLQLDQLTLQLYAMERENGNYHKNLV